MKRSPLISVLAGAGLAAAWVAGAGQTVGRQSDGRIMSPIQQVIAPAGRQVDLPDMRPLVVALSPNGRRLAVSGRTHEIVVLDPETGVLLSRVPLPPEPPDTSKPVPSSDNILKPDEKGQVSFTGLVFSPDGKNLYLSNVNGSIKVFDVDERGSVAGTRVFSLLPADAPRRKEDIPAGLAVSPDGKRLYVALNLSNQLAELDTATGTLIREFDVGVAPYDVVLAGTKAYVSNWGGRRPKPGDVTGPAGRGTHVKVDPRTFVANDGSVSVIDLRTGQATADIAVNLHSSALALSPDGRYLACANAASDNVSVIDTRTDAVVETISVKPSPSDLFGASPNALAFDKKGKYLYVANGTQNAVAVVRFLPANRASRLLGLIPVGWFPGALLHDARRGRLIVANVRGLETAQGLDKASRGMGYNTHQYRGSLSFVPIPKDDDLPRLSAAVWENYHRDKLAQAFLPARPGQRPKPVPERIGEPSLIKHVVYVIKENRTYDQVLGDIGRGRSDPSLCVFGERVTPNQHKMVREFALLDNTYCNGILSAEGHQWSTSAFSTDYVEKSYAGWPRSYPDGMGEDEADALAYPPTGFLWDNVHRNGKTLRDYGEFSIHTVRWADPKKKGDPDWTACWREYNAPKGEILFGSGPAIESLRSHLAAQTVGWNLEVPDQFRADIILKELGEYEQRGTFPDLVLICLPNDHTSGTKEGKPTPEAYVADNDLAFGRIVEALSHSRFWKEMVIFGIEDDPQNGWDHVSGYRTTAYVVGPYVKRGQVVGTFFNTVSLLRTIEQILGLPPMNQFDAAADPMFDAFTETADVRPYAAVANRVPLDALNPPPAKIKDPLLRRLAIQSARLDFSRVDACPEETLNRILWHAVKGGAAPFPLGAASGRTNEPEDERSTTR